jgi:hypothetical protein
MLCAWTISFPGSMDTLATWKGTNLCTTTYTATDHRSCWLEASCINKAAPFRLSYADNALLRGSLWMLSAVPKRQSAA